MRRTTTALCLVLFAAAAAYGENYRIQVYSTVVRATASAFGKRVGSIGFNQPVSMVSEAGGFVQIYALNTGVRGWVYKTAVVPQSTFNKQYASVANSGKVSDSAATAATKGFSDAETSYRRGDVRANWQLVDMVMRQYRYDKDESWWEAFRKRGKLGEFRAMRENPNHGGRD